MHLRPKKKLSFSDSSPFFDGVEQLADHVVKRIAGGFASVKPRPILLTDSDVRVNIASHNSMYG